MSPALPQKLTQPPVMEPQILAALCDEAARTADPAVQQDLSTHAHPDVRRAIARRTDLSETLYRQLSQDPVTEVRTVAMGNLLRRRVANEQRSDARGLLRSRLRSTR